MGGNQSTSWKPKQTQGEHADSAQKGSSRPGYVQILDLSAVRKQLRHCAAFVCPHCLVILKITVEKTLA